MDPIDEHAFFREMHARLVPYIAEQTGVDRETIQAVLDAQAKFWEERPELLDRAHGGADT